MASRYPRGRRSGVSIRKSCEWACRRAARPYCEATPWWLLTCGGTAGAGWACPGAEVGGACFPGQESFQSRAGQGLAAVASAGVEVGGEVGQDVQAGHLGCGGDGPGCGGEPGCVTVPGAVGVFPGHDRPADRTLGGVVIEAD